MVHVPTVAVDQKGPVLRSWDNRRLERPDPPRLSHDGPGLATTPAARGATTKAILQKMQRLASVSGSSLERRHPSSVRPQRGCARRRLTEDHIRLQGDKLLHQHLRTAGPRRAG